MAEFESKVPRPTYAGFTEDQLHEYVEVYNHALQLLEKEGVVQYELLTTPAYPVNLGSDVNEMGFPIDSGAYTAFNRYARAAYGFLFPSSYISSFSEKSEILGLIDICRRRLVGVLEVRLSKDANSSEYDLASKQEFELQEPGIRLALPTHFYRETLEKLQERSDPICENFLRYMALLARAAYERVADYERANGVEPISFDNFFNRNVPQPFQSHAARALQQTVNNYFNFADLLSTITHVEGRTRGLGIPLRQYFIDNEGRRLIAKCGFLDAFQKHISDLVLSLD